MTVNCWYNFNIAKYFYTFAYGAGFGAMAMQNRDIIFKLRDLIELRQKTIKANKRAMKDYLVEYKKSLELDKELKKVKK